MQEEGMRYASRRDEICKRRDEINNVEGSDMQGEEMRNARERNKMYKEKG